jgi:hypothetical protein
MTTTTTTTATTTIDIVDRAFDECDSVDLFSSSKLVAALLASSASQIRRELSRCRLRTLITSHKASSSIFYYFI